MKSPALAVVLMSSLVACDPRLWAAVADTQTGTVAAPDDQAPEVAPPPVAPPPAPSATVPAPPATTAPPPPPPASAPPPVVAGVTCTLWRRYSCTYEAPTVEAPHFWLGPLNGDPIGEVFTDSADICAMHAATVPCGAYASVDHVTYAGPLDEMQTETATVANGVITVSESAARGSISLVGCASLPAMRIECDGSVVLGTP